MHQPPVRIRVAELPETQLLAYVGSPRTIRHHRERRRPRVSRPESRAHLPSTSPCLHVRNPAIWAGYPRALSHRSSELGDSPDGHPATRPEMPMSSSRSGQWIPSPHPMRRQLFRSSGVPCWRRGYHARGTERLRASASSTMRSTVRLIAGNPSGMPTGQVIRWSAAMPSMRPDGLLKIRLSRVCSPRLVMSPLFTLPRVPRPPTPKGSFLETQEAHGQSVGVPRQYHTFPVAAMRCRAGHGYYSAHSTIAARTGLHSTCRTATHKCASSSAHEENRPCPEGAEAVRRF